MIHSQMILRITTIIWIKKNPIYIEIYHLLYQKQTKRTRKEKKFEKFPRNEGKS